MQSQFDRDLSEKTLNGYSSCDNCGCVCSDKEMVWIENIDEHLCRQCFNKIYGDYD
jgi:hypothetical protein